MKRKTSPILHSVGVAAPWQENWNTRTGGDAEGTILTKDCPGGATTRQNQRLAQAGAGIVAAVGAAAALFPSQPQPEPVVGKVAIYELGELAVSHPKTLDTNP